MKRTYKLIIFNIAALVYMIMLEVWTRGILSAVSNRFNLSHGGSFNQTPVSYYFLFYNGAYCVFQYSFMLLVLMSIINLVLWIRSNKKSDIKLLKEGTIEKIEAEKDKRSFRIVAIFNAAYMFLSFVNHLTLWAQVFVFVSSRYWLTGLRVSYNQIEYTAGEGYMFYTENTYFYFYSLLIINVVYLLYLLNKDKAFVVKIRDYISLKYLKLKNYFVEQIK